MQFLQSFMLWGLLGISIPILIHLWRGNRGKIISWAAMHWLSDQESSVVKGMKLENILVLILRIILLVLIVLLLSKVFIASLKNEKVFTHSHLVQPNQGVVDEFRFELTQALDKGENVYWATEKKRNVASTEDLMDVPNADFQLQEALKDLPVTLDSLSIYLGNSSNELGAEFYSVPIQPQLYLSNKYVEKQKNQVIQLYNQKLFSVNDNGIFDSLLLNNNQTVSMKLKNDSFNYYLDRLKDSEVNFIEASLGAIEEVYGFEFTEVASSDSAKIIFSNSVDQTAEKDKLYFNSDEYGFSDQKNVVYFPDQLDFEHSELVRSGRLPEIILDRFLGFAGVNPRDILISDGQLKARFLPRPEQKHGKSANIDLLLLSLFVLTFGLERYFANRQGI